MLLVPLVVLPSVVLVVAVASALVWAQVSTPCAAAAGDPPAGVRGLLLSVCAIIDYGYVVLRSVGGLCYVVDLDGKSVGGLSQDRTDVASLVIS